MTDDPDALLRHMSEEHSIFVNAKSEASRDVEFLRSLDTCGYADADEEPT
jgi:hypothetical protein